MKTSLLFLALSLSACGKANSDSALPAGVAAPGSSLPPASLAAPTPPARDNPASGGTVAPPISTVQQGLHVANQVRRKFGLPEMRADPILSAIAQAHAEDMLKRHYFEHNTPEGLTPFQRMDQAGLQYNAAAENIAMGVNDANKVFDVWLASPGHRANLLNKVYGRHGIGFAGGYWVHDFAN